MCSVRSSPPAQRWGRIEAVISQGSFHNGNSVYCWQQDPWQPNRSHSLCQRAAVVGMGGRAAALGRE